MNELVNDRATIQRSDVFLVSVESRGQDLTVITERGNGSVTLPYVGSMRLAGLTLSQARATVQRAVAARNADTTVRLWIYREK
jgi:protein involved in polysaccharide export with SLBB domain